MANRKDVTSGPLRIGGQLRAARKMQQLTLDQVASSSGLTKSFISRIERDVTSPSVATLVALCDVLSITIGSLFEAPHREIITLAEAPRVQSDGIKFVQHQVTPLDEYRIQVYHSVMEPGATSGEELYSVNCDLEIAHVISGRLEIQFSNDRVLLKSGDTFSFPGRTLHSWHNAHQAKTVILWVMAPGSWGGIKA